MTGSVGSGDDARILVSVEGQELRCRGHDPLETGAAVLAYVRPENIDVLDGSETRQYENILEGVVDRVIFEGPTAQLRVDVAGREMRVDVSGNQRLSIAQRDNHVRLGFDEVTLIPVPVTT